MLSPPEAGAQNQVISLSVSPTSVTENGGAKTISVTVNRFNISTYPITATISVGGSGSATSGTDYAAVSNFDISIAGIWILWQRLVHADADGRQPDRGQRDHRRQCLGGR